MGVKHVYPTMSQTGSVKFPSPCGVMGVKLQSIRDTRITDAKGFPSPCGVMGVKLQFCLAGCVLMLGGFPSPCGVMGVKHVGDQVVFTFTSPYFGVSVPLRGNGCETPHIFEAYTVKLLIGSISIGHLHSQ